MWDFGNRVFSFRDLYWSSCWFVSRPRITLVISETLRNGKKEGIAVAISPLISESPIILIVLVILSGVAENIVLMGAISLLGACFLVYLGLSNLRANINESENVYIIRALGIVLMVFALIFLRDALEFLDVL